MNEKGEAGSEVIPMSNLQSIVWSAATEVPEAIVRLLVIWDPLRDIVRVTVKQLTSGVLAVAFT